MLERLPNDRLCTISHAWISEERLGSIGYEIRGHAIESTHEIKDGPIHKQSRY